MLCVVESVNTCDLWELSQFLRIDETCCVRVGEMMSQVSVAVELGIRFDGEL